ncbi:hypothetical protein E2C01_000346 [Portunus trituberculatus]|uniref:Uncharacterized protein n=1 Tax=Portunus trituberculatus TaxID=210409 RepID=A0A5B7CE31_PORTR|nr:hypothetical protein [Portunus trituberculatus]
MHNETVLVFYLTRGAHRGSAEPSCGYYEREAIAVKSAKRKHIKVKWAERQSTGSQGHVSPGGGHALPVSAAPTGEKIRGQYTLEGIRGIVLVIFYTGEGRAASGDQTWGELYAWGLWKEEEEEETTGTGEEGGKEMGEV